MASRMPLIRLLIPKKNCARGAGNLVSPGTDTLPARPPSGRIATSQFFCRGEAKDCRARYLRRPQVRERSLPPTYLAVGRWSVTELRAFSFRLATLTPLRP